LNQLAPFLPSLTAENAILTRITNPRSWITPKTDITRFYDEHLAGGRSIGMRGADLIQYLMIDIDCHRGEPIQDRLSLLLETFGRSAMPFRSSESGGAHFYIFLDKMTPQTQAREALRNKLVSIKYPGADKVEIFPRSTHGHRLPFGIGNRPMPGGHDTLADTPKADQGKIFQRWFNSEMKPYKAADLLEYTSILEYYQTPVKGQIRAKNSAPQPNPDQLTGKRFFEDPILGVNSLLNRGISDNGMRYRACNALAFYFITYKGMSKDQAERELIAWLEAKHNGQSNGYNANRQKALADIRAIIRGYDETKLRVQKRSPKTAVNRIHFENSEQIQFANAVQKIALKFGRKNKAEYIVGLPYSLIMKDERFKDRNKISRCLSWARNTGLVRCIKAGLPGVSGSVYMISAAIVYGKHQDTIQDTKLAQVQDIVKREGSQKAAALLLGVSANMISKVLTGKTPVPAAWFEGLQVSEINQIHTLHNKSLFFSPFPFLEPKDQRLSIPGGIAFERGKSEKHDLDLFIVKQSNSNGGEYAFY
jgi:hypothetical protein